jgi:hypothetical protein
MSKGSRQRPTNIPMSQADANFEGIFGKRVPTYLKKMIPDHKVVDQDAENEDEAFRIIEQQQKVNNKG